MRNHKLKIVIIKCRAFIMVLTASAAAPEQVKLFCHRSSWHCVAFCFQDVQGSIASFYSSSSVFSFCFFASSAEVPSWSASLPRVVPCSQQPTSNKNLDCSHTCHQSFLAYLSSQDCKLTFDTETLYTARSAEEGGCGTVRDLVPCTILHLPISEILTAQGFQC